MKQVLLTLLCAGVVSGGIAQTTSPTEIRFTGHPECGFDKALRKMNVRYDQLSEAYHQNLAPDGAAQKTSATVYDIPVVFHIVYNATQPSYNIPDSVILNQLQVLNKAFRKTHADVGKTRAVFKPLSADAQIQFHLATKTPTGAATTGITRTVSSRLYFGSSGGDLDSLERVKSKATGGVDPWPTNKYYNIWICNMTDAAGNLSVLGYGIPPTNPVPNNWPPGVGGEFAGLIDGVVLQVHAVGSNNPIGAPLADVYTRGRALVHETGHYLGLQHVFGTGDGSTNYCGTITQNDGIGDTPEQSEMSFTAPGNSPSATKNSCGSGPKDTVDMWENYMDYTTDSFQTMFTIKQVALMYGVIGNQRAGLNSPTSVPELTALPAMVIYPNPAGSFVKLDYTDKIERVLILDYLGRQALQLKGAAANAKSYDVSRLAAGNYMLQIEDENGKRSVGRFTVLR